MSKEGGGGHILKSLPVSFYIQIRLIHSPATQPSKRKDHTQRIKNDNNQVSIFHFNG